MAKYIIKVLGGKMGFFRSMGSKISGVFSDKNSIVYLCFFISGISALIYEMAWPSRIQLMMGYTIYAITITLCAYLAGLALGALFAERLQKISISSFFLYVVVELLVGLYGIFFNKWCDLVEKVYSWPLHSFDLSLSTLTVVQFFFCSLVIIFPTFLMGTTLPLLANYLYKEKNELSIKLPHLYGINAVGGLVGILLGGFYLLPTIGQRNTLLTAVWLNFVLVAIAVIFFPPGEFPSRKEWWNGIKMIFRKNAGVSSTGCKKDIDQGPVHSYSKFLNGSYLGMLLISGVVSILVQVLWNRLTAMVIGPSVYVFPTVTAVILAGIVIGSYLMTKFSDNIELGRKFVLFLPAVAAIAFWIGTYLFTNVPYWVFYWHQNWQVGYWNYTLLSLGSVMICLLPASTLLGMLFPLAISALAWDHSRPQYLLSRGYALNIFGLVLGSLLGTFVIMPSIGVEGISYTIFCLLVALSILMIVAHRKAAPKTHTGLSILVVLIITIPWVAIFESYDWYLLTAGLFYNRRSQKEEKQLMADGLLNHSNYARWPINLILDKNDDPYATISIHEYIEDRNTRLFKINGKVDGNSTGDEGTCKIVGLLPLFVRPDARDLLMVGLGTGISFAKILEYPSLQKAKLIELSPSMIRFSQKYFNELNNRVWSDPKASIVNRDGREYLKHTSDKYDLILSEPSNPWLDGVGSLFTTEFFSIAYERLHENGVLLNWFHGYGLDCITVLSVMKSMASVFPSMLVFKRDGDYYLIGQKREGGVRLRPLDNTIPRNLKNDIYGALLSSSSSGVNFDNDFDTYQKIIQELLVADGDMLNRYKNLANNTDDNQYLQYNAGRTFFQNVSCDLSSQLNNRELKHRYQSQ